MTGPYVDRFLKECNRAGIFAQPCTDGSARGVQLGQTFEVPLLLIIRALTSARICPKDVSMIRIGPCGQVPTRPIEVDPNGDILARFGVALDLNGPALELVHGHAPLQALSRILNAPPESNLVVDIDLKYVPGTHGHPAGRASQVPTLSRMPLAVSRDTAAMCGTSSSRMPLHNPASLSHATLGLDQSRLWSPFGYFTRRTLAPQHPPPFVARDQQFFT